ncbi:uncharacterized protein Tco025E_01473 [Trypanosoma conorhini]|uniref:Uncharacterized protein n=1 Tax=Trypanosoma conorhini TaxID=83891 RepID=A0A422Q8K1_9TRYP|nr:uncharacterized protein Tco025E_01473 [Trypanosoma conorhini]RNF26257.1 hypothetical protein Tco025E_01473 [Trypanosoma conorhini]
MGQLQCFGLGGSPQPKRGSKLTLARAHSESDAFATGGKSPPRRASSQQAALRDAVAAATRAVEVGGSASAASTACEACGASGERGGRAGALSAAGSGKEAVRGRRKGAADSAQPPGRGAGEEGGPRGSAREPVLRRRLSPHGMPARLHAETAAPLSPDSSSARGPRARGPARRPNVMPPPLVDFYAPLRSSSANLGPDMFSPPSASSTASVDGSASPNSSSQDEDVSLEPVQFGFLTEKQQEVLRHTTFAATRLHTPPPHAMRSDAGAGATHAGPQRDSVRAAPRDEVVRYGAAPVAALRPGCTSSKAEACAPLQSAGGRAPELLRSAADDRATLGGPQDALGVLKSQRRLSDLAEKAKELLHTRREHASPKAPRSSVAGVASAPVASTQRQAVDKKQSGSHAATSEPSSDSACPSDSLEPPAVPAVSAGALASVATRTPVLLPDDEKAAAKASGPLQRKAVPSPSVRATTKLRASALQEAAGVNPALPLPSSLPPVAPNETDSNANAVHVRRCGTPQGRLDDAAAANVPPRAIVPQVPSPSPRQRPVRSAVTWLGDCDDGAIYYSSSAPVDPHPPRGPARASAAVGGSGVPRSVPEEKPWGHAPAVASSDDDEELLEGFYPKAFLVGAGHRSSSSIVFVLTEEDSFPRIHANAGGGGARHATRCSRRRASATPRVVWVTSPIAWAPHNEAEVNQRSAASSPRQDGGLPCTEGAGAKQRCRSNVNQGASPRLSEIYRRIPSKYAPDPAKMHRPLANNFGLRRVE